MFVCVRERERRGGEEGGDGGRKRNKMGETRGKRGGRRGEREGGEGGRTDMCDDTALSVGRTPPHARLDVYSTVRWILRVSTDTMSGHESLSGVGREG